jgi:hypothetical protein
MSETKFLNVDLDLRGKTGIRDVLDGLGRDIIELNCETAEFACVEVSCLNKNIDDLISEYFRLVTGLSKEARSIWNRLDSRIFNIGIQAGDAKSSEFHLSAKSVSQIQAMGGEIAITVYGKSSDKP